MKKLAVIFLIILFSLTVFAQKPKKPVSTGKTKLVATKPLGTEKEEFEKAVAQALPVKRIAALQEFLKNFPKSGEKTRAQELIVSARAELGEQKLQNGETQAGADLFKLALKEAPAPLSERLFADVVLTIPTNLFWRGQRVAALEVAQIIEEKISGNAKQLLGLATFYLGTENPTQAKRLAEEALELDPNLTAAYQTLGLASRMDFQLDDAVSAYTKALELDPDSTVSRRSLAEMKRAVGKPDEAAALYREILLKDETDLAAQTGLALSLFDSNKRAEAEAQMRQTLEANPNNLFMLVGAAYWYAAHNDGAKAVELAQKAFDVEPRYTWAHIALARGLLAQKKPLEAEKALLTAQQYGNFPTLDYEIATARMQAGFYREAAEGLKKSFAVEDGLVKTQLGGRVLAEAKSFIELLALERRASIFEPLAADDLENAGRLKSLLYFSQKIEVPDIDETQIAQAADEFVKGDDKMKIHRYLYAADRLLEKNTALPKVLELSRATVGNVEAGLDVPAPAAAVMADDLYQSRAQASARGQILVVPDVPRQTLSAILRGRIEEIAGWSLYRQEKTGEAVVRLKRAVSVLPEKSLWWRSSMWRLGAALEADGKQAAALDAYVKSYADGEPSAAKYLVIEMLYQKVNGSSEGLEAKIGAKPALLTETFSRPTEAVAQVTEDTKPEPPTEIKPETKPETSPTPTEEITPPVESSPRPTPEVSTQVETESTVEAKPVATPEISATPEEKESVGETSPTPEEIQPTLETTPTPTEVEPETVSSLEKTKPETASTPQADVENSAKPTRGSEKSAKVNKSVSVAKTNTERKSEPKSLFEPIVITIPPPEKTKSVKPREKTEEENQTSETINAVRTQPEEDTAKIENTGDSRPRMIVKTTEEITPCKISVSEESISILSEGGSLGILVTPEGEGVSSKITAKSSSPRDVVAVLDKGIGAISKQAFFIIRSISAKKGEFTITFEAPCGKKEISVRVR